ncbi:MAG: hypothetical protein ACFB10_19915 [Salibacteraceae bacterium]
MKKFVLRFLVFIALLLLMTVPMSIWITNEHFYTYNKQSWILSQEGRDLDFAVIGSSRVYYNVDINTIEQTLGSKGINLGTSGSNYAESYLLLKEFLKTNRLEKLLINCDESALDALNRFGNYPFHLHEFLPQFEMEEHEEVFFDYLPPWKFYLWKSLPVAKYLEYNDRYTFFKYYNHNLDISNGTLVDFNVEKGKMNKSENTFAIASIDVKYLNRMLELCHANGISVLFIHTPLYVEVEERASDYWLFMNQKIVGHYPFIDFKGIFDNSDLTLFSDYTHLNRKGSILYSKQLATALKEYW